MKRFGYLRDYMHFNIYNTSKMLYMNHPVYGVMELPRYPTGRKTYKISAQAKNYAKRVEYERYLNPKGLKPTVTAGFPLVQQKHDFTNIELYRVPSKASDGPNTMCFRSAPWLSKPEVKQFLIKLYGLPVITIRSVRRVGKIKRLATGKYKREKDIKKWIVKLAIKRSKVKTEDKSTAESADKKENESKK